MCKKPPPGSVHTKAPPTDPIPFTYYGGDVPPLHLEPRFSSPTSALASPLLCNQGFGAASDVSTGFIVTVRVSRVSISLPRVGLEATLARQSLVLQGIAPAFAASLLKSAPRTRSPPNPPPLQLVEDHASPYAIVPFVFECAAFSR